MKDFLPFFRISEATREQGYAYDAFLTRTEAFVCFECQDCQGSGIYDDGSEYGVACETCDSKGYEPPSEQPMHWEKLWRFKQ